MTQRGPHIKLYSCDDGGYFMTVTYTADSHWYGVFKPGEELKMMAKVMKTLGKDVMDLVELMEAN